MAGKLNTRNAQAPAQDQDDFLEGGEERTISEIWSPKSVGEAMIGKVIGFRETKTRHSKSDTDTVTIAEFSPVVIRHADGSLDAFGALAVMLSAQLRLRINAGKDNGKIFALAYKGTEKTASGNMNVYAVVEQNDAKLRAMLDKAGVSDDLPF
jgi:hypothetical protein